ncbi:MAG: hypothetical protein JST59_00455 [Actinobacteria bacterium]|nr:hypothetical protein [Actinomycetota bacterium]
MLRNAEKKYEVTVAPVTLKGYEDLLQIMERSSNKTVREEAASFVCMLYSNYKGEGSKDSNGLFYQLCDSLISKVKQDSIEKKESQLLGHYTLLEEMMNATEAKGVGKLLPHSSLVCTESVNITVNNQVTCGYYIPRKHETKFPSNKTLYELLVELAKKFKCSPAEIQLRHGERQIKQRCNGLTIQQLGLRDVELTAHSR